MRRNNFNADITDEMLEMGDFSQIMVMALWGAFHIDNADDAEFVVEYILRHKGELSELDKADCINIATGMYSQTDNIIWQELVDGLSG